MNHISIRVFIIAITDIFQFFKQKKLMFIVMILGIIVTQFGGMFFLNMMGDAYTFREDVRIMDHAYIFANTVNIPQNKLINILEEIDTTDDLPKVGMIALNSPVDIENSVVLSGQAGNYMLTYAEGCEFTKNDGGNKLIYPSEFLNYKKKLSYVGDTITLGQDEYSIVGATIGAEDEKMLYEDKNTPFQISIANNMLAGTNNIHNHDAELDSIFPVIIPYKTYIEKRYPVACVKIAFNSSLNTKQKAKLSAIFESCATKDSFLISMDDSNANMLDIQQIIMVFLALLLCAFSIVCFFRYWIKLNQTKYISLFLCGAKPFQVFIIKLLELFLLNLIGMIMMLCLNLLSGLILPSPITNITFSNLGGLFVLVFLITVIVCYKDIFLRYSIRREE